MLMMSFSVSRLGTRVLKRNVKTLSARSIEPMPISRDPPEFDGTGNNNNLHWLLAVDKRGVA